VRREILFRREKSAAFGLRPRRVVAASEHNPSHALFVVVLVVNNNLLWELCRIALLSQKSGVFKNILNVFWRCAEIMIYALTTCRRGDFRTAAHNLAQRRPRFAYVLDLTGEKLVLRI
jgi:hypothetical protein